MKIKEFKLAWNPGFAISTLQRSIKAPQEEVWDLRSLRPLPVQETHGWSQPVPFIHYQA